MKKRVTDKKSPLFDEHDYIKSCSSKKSYSSEYIAQYEIDTLKTKNPKLKLSCYLCPYCNSYHLTERN